MVFGALRLARFNIQIVDLHEKGDFKGLPIPVSAITIALLVMSFHKDNYIIKPFDQFVIPLIIFLSLLMVSNIRYNALPKLRDKKLKWKIYLFAILLIALVLSIWTNGEILFYIFFGIVAFGVLRYLFNLVVKKKIN
jgi:CDP-diacylglycerol--serine O-phosphatidyltransferase